MDRMLSGECRYCITGDGDLLCGGCGIGPFGAGFCGGIESRFITRNGRLLGGLSALRRGEPDPTDAESVISEVAVVVAKLLVPETAESGTGSSVDSLESLGASLSHEP
jgi:hypothetical protein